MSVHCSKDHVSRQACQPMAVCICMQTAVVSEVTSLKGTELSGMMCSRGAKLMSKRLIGYWLDPDYFYIGRAGLIISDHMGFNAELHMVLEGVGLT